MKNIVNKAPSFFDISDNLAIVSSYDKIENKLNDLIDWKIFLPILEKCFYKENKGIGGRPHYDYILLLKIIILQKYYNLSDEMIVCEIYNRLSFINFLGTVNAIPEKSTIWNFKEALIRNNVIDKIFNTFTKLLKNKGLIINKGVIVDSTFAEVPKQRNTKEENEIIKEGKIPENWSNSHKISQKDIDATWTIKRNEVFYGYKNHIKIDASSKLIINSFVTTAKVHDSKVIDKLVKKEDKFIYADSAYVGTEDKLPKESIKYICQKGFKNNPLDDKKKKKNKEISKIRCRVEHIFGTMKTTMKDAMKFRTIGKKRAKFNIVLANFVYNLLRFKFLISNESPREALTF